MRLLYVLLFISMPVLAFEYRGDGSFTDRGRGAAFERYRLVLPPISLCQPGNYSFLIGELPADALFLEMEYPYPRELTTEDAYNLQKQIQRGITVRLVLEDVEAKSIVYNYEGKFYESGHDESGKAFSRGFPGVVENLYGRIVFRVDVDFHKGFFWQHHSAKKMNFTVISPLPSLPKCYANFVISGGGWK